MSAPPLPGAAPIAPLEVHQPVRQTLPLVLSSPHSGEDYPADFIAASRLDRMTLRRSEDSFVDELFAAAPSLGAPLIRALFPRAYVDPNREPWELDPAMFEDELPSYANTASPRVAAGLGTIARVVANGEEIYGGKLRFADAKARVERCYQPYHAALSAAVTATYRRFGRCLLLDCHSMPSIGGPQERDAGRDRVDFVLGDCFASACAPSIVERVERVLKDQGFVVARNTPYAGGYVTQHYGRPSTGVHALQIEINRALYMDEALLARGPGFPRLAETMTGLVREIGRMFPVVLAE
jgi:N-formylglutamate amidohydrolase